jgi:hypothetical protein
MSNVIPIEIEALGFKLKNGVSGNTNSLANTTSIVSQGNEQNLNYIVKFSDGTQKVTICNGNQLQVDLAIWSWRINNKKTEQDYVDFGVDFSTLERGLVIHVHKVMKLLGISNISPKNFSEVRNMVEIEQRFKYFFQLEIQRYFKEQRNDIVRLETTMGGGLKIPPKPSKAVWGFLGFLVFFLIIGNSFYKTTSSNQVSESQLNNQVKQDTYECAERTGMGETVSREDINKMDRCLKDKGY